jgi:hypothetical protein
MLLIVFFPSCAHDLLVINTFFSIISTQLIKPQAALAEQEQISAALAVVEVSARVLLQGRIYEESFTAEKIA